MISDLQGHQKNGVTPKGTATLFGITHHGLLLGRRSVFDDVVFHSERRAPNERKECSRRRCFSPDDFAILVPLDFLFSERIHRLTLLQLFEEALLLRGSRKGERNAAAAAVEI
jgi:hypothetical protein